MRFPVTWSRRSQAPQTTDLSQSQVRGQAQLSVKPKPRLRLALGSSGEQSGQLLWGHLEVASPLVANPVSPPAWTSPQSLSGSGGWTRIALAGNLAAAELQRDRRPSRSPRGGSHSSPISQELDGGREVALVDLLDQLGGVPSNRTDRATPRLPVPINLEAWVMVIMERARPE